MGIIHPMIYWWFSHDFPWIAASPAMGEAPPPCGRPAESATPSAEPTAQWERVGNNMHIHLYASVHIIYYIFIYIYTYACVCVCEYNVITSGIHIQNTCFPNTGMNHDEPKKGLKNRKDLKQAETTISKSASDLASSTPQFPWSGDHLPG